MSESHECYECANPVIELTEEQAKFLEAWKYHIEQLATLAFQANAYDEFLIVKAQLRCWIYDTSTMKGLTNPDA